MGARSQPRERIFSILNDNDSPSFAIPARRSPAPTVSSSLTSPRQGRPSLLRQIQFKRTSSFSSTGSTSANSPPLLRFDSSSSKSSNSSMDSSPSPITPAFNYHDSSLLAFDPMLRAEMAGFAQQHTTITPLLEQQLMIPLLPSSFLNFRWVSFPSSQHHLHLQWPCAPQKRYNFLPLPRWYQPPIL
jgi:hypothetical protein